MTIRICSIPVVLFCVVACAECQYARPVVADNDAEESSGVELRYVPSPVALALWRRPVEYRAWDDSHRSPVFFSKPETDSGTTHPLSVVGMFKYGGREIAIAVDAEDPDATRGEGVRVDMSGKGDFRAAELLPFGPGGGVQHGYGPAVVTLELDGKTVPFMAWGRYDRWSQGRIIQFEGYLAAEGLVEIAGKDYPVRIIDSSKNWKLGDKPQPEWGLNPYFSGDSLAIETGDEHFENPETILKIWYGQPVEIDGRLYDIRLTEDGKELRARELPADEVGTVRLAGAKSFWGVLMSKDYVLNISNGDGSEALVPAGEYIVLRMGATFGEGEQTRSGSLDAPEEALHVSPGSVADIPVPGRQAPKEPAPEKASEIKTITLD